MKRRKKYKPKPVLSNPLGYVIEGMASVTSYGDYLLDLSIKHHNALALLVKGEATKANIDTLISGANMTEALLRLDLGQAYADEMRKGQDALYAVASRGAVSGRFILKGEEMQAINMLFELHDAQMNIATIKDIERAIDIVEKDRQAKKMRVITK
jgi:hypothetical protein